MMKVEATDRKQLPPFLRKYLKAQDENPNDLILQRLGDQWAVFFDRAHDVAEICNTSISTLEVPECGPVTQTGFPRKHLEIYVQLLIRAGLTVCFSE